MWRIILRPGEDGYWIAECPSLPPVISQRAAKEEAIANVTEAIQLYLDVLREEGRMVPACM